MIAVDLIKQQELDADPKAIQQMSFTGNLNQGENVNDNTMFFRYWKSERNSFRFFTNDCKSILFLYYKNDSV